MRTDMFDYELPKELIAQKPAPRGDSRLLVIDRRHSRFDHRRTRELPSLLHADDLLLLNDTRVIPARLAARRASGRRFELLLLRRLEIARWETLLRPSARVRAGERLALADGGVVIPEVALGEGRWEIQFEPMLELDRLDEIGEPPLPPYILRPHGAIPSDAADYQTVYAAAPGAVAAPTAGLHFTEAMLAEAAGRGIELVFLTLHVGLGTFRPVQVDEVEHHDMHEEWYEFSDASAAAVNAALAGNRRIVCVGTTSVRALESALADGKGIVVPGAAWTRLFITPGFRFLGVGGLLTNFHLPRSTLLMLVSGFAGRERVLEAYRAAIDRRYRFYSYGDAMLIL